MKGNVLLFPNNSEEISMKFYFKFFLLMLSTSGHTLGITLHFIKNTKDGNFTNFDLDIAFLISLLGCYYFLLGYLKNIKKIIKLSKFLSNFESFGEPPEFEARNRQLNKLSLVHYIYILTAIVAFSSAPKIEQHLCEKDNMEKNLHEVCGIIGFAWWPFDFTHYKNYYFIYQIFSIYIVYHSASVISFYIMETTEHLIVRLRHVRSCFEDALNEKDNYNRKIKFKVAVRYHGYVIEMLKLMNQSFIICLFVHILLTGAILGCVGFRLTTTFSLGSICLYIGWLISLIMVCYSGEKLTKETTSIAEIVYNYPWYNFDVDLQKDIKMVILRSQEPLYLEAGSFGKVNYRLIMTVMKTSYSYLTLLNNAS